MNVYEYEARLQMADRKIVAWAMVWGCIFILGIGIYCIANFEMPEISFHGVDLGSGEAFEGSIGFN